MSENLADGWRDQVRVQQGQLALFKIRTRDLLDALLESQSALEHAQLSIVVDEVKRSTSLAVHKTQRVLDDDARRYAVLDTQ